MIRVLHVIDHLGLGGAQSVLLDLAANADAAGLRCEVAAMHGRGIFADELEKRGIKVHSLSRAKWPPAYLRNFARLLRAGEYDVLHFHLPGANWIAKPLSALFSRAKRVAHDHSSADLAFRRWWSMPPDALAHFFSHHVVAVSEGVAGFLAVRECVPRRKITVVANGIDVRLFRPATTEQRNRARESLGIDSKSFVFGALGRLAPEKNFLSLVELARRMPSIDFVIGGEGPERETLSRAAAGTPNFRLLGGIADRLEFYAALDGFLLPSLHEALPMTLLEAMACGVPVIASDLEGVSAALGDAGVLVTPGNTSALHEAVRSFVADPAAAKERTKTARERVVELFDARAVSREIASVYRSILS